MTVSRHVEMVGRGHVHAAADRSAARRSSAIALRARRGRAGEPVAKPTTTSSATRSSSRSRRRPRRSASAGSGSCPASRAVAEKAMTVAGPRAALTAMPDVGAPDYSDDGMLQYLRTERIMPPYQTRGYKLVELVRIYEAGRRAAFLMPADSRRHSRCATRVCVPTCAIAVNEVSLVPSLLQAIVHIDGEALVMHAGDKPYVVAPTGQVELASRGLTLDAVNGIVAQLLPVEVAARARRVRRRPVRAAAAAPNFPASISRSSSRAAATTCGPKFAAGASPDDDRVPGRASLAAARTVEAVSRRMRRTAVCATAAIAACRLLGPADRPVGRPDLDADLDGLPCRRRPTGAVIEMPRGTTCR